MRRKLYPFTAIVGRENIKRALMLALVNPRTGGLLISGAAGTGKSMLVRAAEKFTATGKIYELPLGATEDMVFGSADIEAALKGEGVKINKGILHRAKESVLYIDEVNLLRADFLTALLDSAAAGFFELQRDGISHRESVSFTPIGTMNPKEGTFGATVLDRFGLFVSVEEETDEKARTEIMRRSLDFERDADAFIERYEVQERALGGKLTAARELLPSVAVSDAIINLVAVYCAKANTAGNRAELFLLETARAVAALEGRSYILPSDVDEAALYVLPQRMTSPPEQPGETSSQQSEESNSDEDNSEDDNNDDESEEDESAHAPTKNESETKEKDERDKNEEQEESERDKKKSAEERVFDALKKMFMPRLFLDDEGAREKSDGSGKRKRTRTDKKSGRFVRAELHRKGQELDLAFAATLRAAAPHQPGRQGSTAVVIRPEDYRKKVREKRVGANLIFLVDASGSMGAKSRMRAVKGVILSLLNEAYQKRDRVALIAFRRDRAETLLPPTRSVDLAQKLLQSLPTGGKTPLAAGLEAALSLAVSLEKREKGQDTVLILLTDGRPNAVYEGEDPIEAALMAAEKIARTKAFSLVLDTEVSYPKLGIARKIAQKLGAPCYTPEKLSEQSILRLVSTFR